jgi:DNA-binding MarR family transcriptional regulator
MSSGESRRSKLLSQIAVAMRRTSGLGVLHSQAMAARLGINSTDLECLDLVVLGEASTAGELARRTGLTTGAITGVTDRLEHAGFMRRQRDVDDRRKVHLQATRDFHSRATRFGRPMQKRVMGVLSAYDHRDLDFLLKVLNQLGDAAEAAIGDLHKTR